MYHEFKTIFNEDKEKPISEKDLIKKILKVFFNAHKEYEEEYSKAKVEYNEEILREAKIDICTVEFWRDSFETIKEWERELLKLW
jgi:oligoendopeptidase F